MYVDRISVTVTTAQLPPSPSDGHGRRGARVIYPLFNWDFLE